MHIRRSSALQLQFSGLLFAILFSGMSLSGQSQSSPESRGTSACANDDTGLRIPPGFCATVFADDIGHARHLVVSSSGVVYVNTWSGAYYGNTPPHEGGFLVAMQDESGNGKASLIQRFGETVQTGGAGGTGIGIYKGSLYAEINDRIVRYTLDPGSVAPKGPPVTIVSGLPLGGDHPMHPFVIDPKGAMYVDVASATNACQAQNRVPQIPGANPCTELKTRGGVWLYDANKPDQRFSPAERFATGIRNASGLTMDPTGDHIFVTQHGRDQLHTNWPELYRPEEEATQPAEELVLLRKDGDYGWPACYYDAIQGKRVLAPEYGGDGGKKVGACAQKIPPVAAFPAHWGPNAVAYYDKSEFPARYRRGVFIAFHGSWNRAPYPQNGYNIVFQPLKGGIASGGCEIFADGFAGAVKSPDKAVHRPSGLAVGPDGSLYVSDDIRGRIYRIFYQGGTEPGPTTYTPCPSPSAPASEIASTVARSPEDEHAIAESSSSRSVPKGATREMVAMGERIYHGQAGSANCAGCHGENAEGSVLGPGLTGKTWLWSDGSFTGIMKSIADGVPQPKQFRSPMPPKGGAKLTDEQVAALAAFIWSLSHP